MKSKYFMKNFTHESVDLLANVFEAAAEGIIVANQQGEILMANPASEQMFGYEQGALPGQKVESLLPSDIRKRHTKLRDQFHHDPKTRPMGQGLDLYGMKKDGSTFPLEISLSYFYFEGEMRVMAFIVDNTERKKAEDALKQSQEQLKEYTQTLESRVKERTRELEHLNLGLQSQVQERKMAEQALRESQKLYRAIARNYPNGTINVLDENWEYIFVDGKDLRDKGLSRNALIGTSYLHRFPEEKQEEIRSELQTIHENKEVSFEIEINNQYYRITAVPLNSASMSGYQILVVEENITSLKEAEQEIRHALEKEKELNELKSRFVSMASHEFRTPLSTILSSVSLISKYTTTEQQPKREKHIDRIRNSVKHLTDILNDFLSIGKLEEGRIQHQPVQFDLKQWMESTIEETDPQLREGQEIQYNHEGTNTVYCDDKLLRNIMSNLLSNAIKYSPENSAIQVRSVLNNEQLRIDVVDQGMGIPEEEQKNIFDRFFRAENVTNIKGTGLGLNIVQKYLELMGGNVSFESKPESGTVFTVKIPQ